MAAGGLYESIVIFQSGLESIGKLEDKLVHLGRVVAVQKFVVAFKEQRGGDIINVADGVAPGVEIKQIVPVHRVIAVLEGIEPAHEFHVVDDRQFQVQAGQLVTGLNPPALLTDCAEVVASILGLDIFTLDLKAGAKVQRGIEDSGRPKVIARVVPFTRLCGDAEFQIAMGFEGQKYAEPPAAVRLAVQVRHSAVGRKTHVAARNVKLRGIAGAVRRAGAVDTINGIVDELAAVADGNCAAH